MPIRCPTRQDDSQTGCQACVGKLEANRETSDATAEHQEVPKVEAAVETIGALKDLYGDLHVAVRRRRQPKKWTQDTAARRWMTRRAVPAPHKGRGRHRPRKDDVRGTPKGRMFEKRWWRRPKATTAQGTETWDGSKKVFYEDLGQIIGLKVKTSVGLRKMSVKTLWRNQPESRSY
jgi:hypothetical protein